MIALSGFLEFFGNLFKTETRETGNRRNRNRGFEIGRRNRLEPNRTGAFLLVSSTVSKQDSVVQYSRGIAGRNGVKESRG